jgi:Flp pilus assembly protein TadB
MWTTTPGVVLLVIWLTLNLLGFFTMRRVLAIDI